MAHEGFVDEVNETEVRGWVYDNQFPNEPLPVEILAGDKVIAVVPAQQFRQDLLVAGKGNGAHGFRCSIDGPHDMKSLVVRVQGKRWLLPRSDDAPRSPPRFHQAIAHTLEYGLPEVPGGFTKAAPPANEEAIVGRIIEAYHRALADDPQRGDSRFDMWSNLTAVFHQEILDLLQRRDVSGTSQYLRDAHDRGLTHGISQGSNDTVAFRTNAEFRKQGLAGVADKLASLGEYLGVLNLESPNQHGQWGENLHLDPNITISKISAAVGIPIVPPQIMGSYFGIQTTDGVLTGRDILALYGALRIRAVMTNEMGVARPRICEIGGGLGSVAYYSVRLGAGSYTIIDLPVVSALQAYYLLTGLPELNVCLYGERETSPAAIHLLPTYCFQKLDREYDILFNQDSIPEMHPDYSLAYLRQAQNNVRHCFLSINQEAQAWQTTTRRQTVVRDLVREVGGFRNVYRFRHWLRAGYAEELYYRERRVPGPESTLHGGHLAGANNGQPRPGDTPAEDPLGGPICQLEAVVVDADTITLEGWTESCESRPVDAFRITCAGHELDQLEACKELPGLNQVSSQLASDQLGKRRFWIKASLSNLAGVSSRNSIITCTPLSAGREGHAVMHLIEPVLPLPPQELIQFVGGGFPEVSMRLLPWFVQSGGLKRDSHVLDVGCGFGRIAYALAHYLAPTARYEGFDIVDHLVAWAQQSITPRFPNFQFQKFDIQNNRYNPFGMMRPSELQFPYEDESFDFVFLTSIFTHMLAADVKHYLKEIRRVLRPQGSCLLTCLLINETSISCMATGKSSLNLVFPLEECWTENPGIPESAIGFREEQLQDWIANEGLILRSKCYGSWCGRQGPAFQDAIRRFHDILICQK